MKYPLASDTWDEREKEALYKVIESGRYTMGPKVEEFEEKFAKKFGVKHAIMVNSGSSANLLMIASLAHLGVFPPDAEIIVPAVSWSTTYFPVHQLGLKLVFVDVDASLNIDPWDIIAHITDKTEAILAVNLLGNPCDMETLQYICRENNIMLLEDNCESLGATYRGKYAGTFGEIGTFSFFFSHHLQTMEGGMVVTNNDYIAEIVRSMRAHGWTRNLKTDLLYKNTGNPFKDSFTFITPGYCLRPLEMSGAVGCVQLDKMDDMISMRRKNAEYFREKIPNDCSIKLQKVTEHSDPSWFGFSMIVDNRDSFVDHLYANGIESRPIVSGDFTQQPVMKYLNYSCSGVLHYSKMVQKCGLFVGNDSIDIQDRIDHFSDVIGAFDA